MTADHGRLGAASRAARGNASGGAFRPRRHLMTASGYRSEVTIRFAIWDQVTGLADLPAEA
ncbi:hypothetical protein ACFWBS_44440 [Streptomyces mirabilis]|uniref:hypothetical protein n=1 Tax=Streptomyces mirabilis TaxID=68239 RepID=UPI003655986F